MLAKTFERSQPLAVQQWILLDSFDSAQDERTLRELRAQIRELEERNQELEACARMVTHDLKTPLCVVMGLATTLRQDHARLSVDEQHMCFDNLVRAASKMNNMIDELMLLARLRDAKVVTRPLDMAAIVAEAQSRLTHMIHDSQAEIRLPGAWPKAEGYGPWVEEVWVNYIKQRHQIWRHVLCAAAHRAGWRDATRRHRAFLDLR
jgi:light-regulated signal transduction histidine kinase (bacteriophytochrome)